MDFLISEIEELDKVSSWLIEQHQDQKIWLFKGEMGAGKTTLIKNICDHLKVEDIVNSPTFSIVNEYLTEEDSTIFHFDFYRVEEEKEAVDIGVDEYFYSGDLCLIEWGEKIPSLLPSDYIEISINLENNSERKISVRGNG